MSQGDGDSNSADKRDVKPKEELDKFVIGWDHMADLVLHRADQERIFLQCKDIKDAEYSILDNNIRIYSLLIHEWLKEAPQDIKSSFWRSLSAALYRSSSKLLRILFHRRLIELPPGARLWSIAEFIYSKKTYETVFEPSLRDLQDEYYEALAQGRVWKAKWVRIRHYWAFVSAVVAQLWMSMMKKALELFKVSGP